MITRTVRAENMLAALEVIKQDLGPDALVVSVRQVMEGPSWQVWKKPLVEVVAIKGDGATAVEQTVSENEFKPAVEPVVVNHEATANLQQLLSRTYKLAKQPETLPPEETPTVDAPEKPSTQPVQINSPVKDNSSDFDRLMSTLEAIKSEKKKPTIIRSRPESLEPSLSKIGLENDGSVIYPPVLMKIYQQLQRQGLDGSLLQRLSRTCIETLTQKSLQDKERVVNCLKRQLEAGLKTQKEAPGSIPKLIFLVGTSGVGKTSVCAKLAVHFLTTLGLKVGWICADTVRIGALAEARTYAETIGIPLNVAYTPEELIDEVDTFKKSLDCVLVDTAAFNSRNETSMVDLGNMLTAVSQRSTWVVSTATAKEVDLQNSIAALGPFKPRGLIITKLDETNNFNAVYNLAWRTQLPLYYFSYGSRVVNDLTPAKTELLVNALFEERFSA